MKLFTGNLRNMMTSKNSASKEKGQSLTEMALGMTIFVFILSGVIDIGRAYFTYVALEDAAGEAAMYMSTNIFCPYDSATGIAPNQVINANDNLTGQPDSAGNGNDNTPKYYNSIDGKTTYDGGRCDPPNNAAWRAINSGGSAGIINWNDPSKTSWNFVCYNPANPTVAADCQGAKADWTVQVTITYKFNLLSPVIPNINGSPTLPLTGTASTTIVSVRDLDR